MPLKSKPKQIQHCVNEFQHRSSLPLGESAWPKGRRGFPAKWNNFIFFKPLCNIHTRHLIASENQSLSCCVLFFIIVERGKCGQAVGLFLFLPAVNHLQFKQGPKCDFPFSSLAAIPIMCTFISYFYLRLSFCPPTSLSVCLVLQSAVLSCFVIKLVTPREGEREFC